MEISCAFAPSAQTPDHIALAEELGYRRAWCYDSPALYSDVWATMALAAARTQRIGLATGVLIPSLRHVLITASAIATIEGLAPGRVVAGIGSGFTGRRVLGQPAMRWADVAAYTQALRGLLRGEDVEWDGSVLRMCHPDGFAPARPIEVPFVFAAEGPRGLEVARRLGDGISIALSDPPEGFDWVVRLTFGTVLDEDESPTSDRVYEAAGHAASLAYHVAYELEGRDAVLDLPGGEEWLRRIEAVPEPVRHLAIHDGHLVTVNQLDREVMPREMVAEATLTGTAAQLRERLDELAASGVTEIMYQPAGPDIPRELRAFAAMAPSASAAS